MSDLCRTASVKSTLPVESVMIWYRWF